MWRDNEAKGIGSIHEKMQQQVPLVVDDSLVGTRIEYLSEFDIEDPDQESTKILEWCGGVVERICDGTWLIPGARTKCYKEGEAAEILWDAIPIADIPPSRSIERLDPKKWSTNVIGAWRKDFGDISYGL